MAKRFERKLAFLVKHEATYATDPVPTGAENAVVATDVSLTPIEADEVSRNLYLPYMGAQESLWAGEHTSISFKVEIAGSGTPGLAPAYGPLLRACGIAETITVDEKVEYEPVSGNFESAAFYCNLDGVNHVGLGARGSVKLGWTPKQIPYYEFALQALLGPIADVALPALTLDAFIAPLVVSKANTPVYSIHGHSAIAESFSFDLGNQVEGRFLIGEDSIQITDRKSSASAVIEATSLATKDWFGIWKARTKGAIAIQHGLVDGNIVEFSAARAQLGKPTLGATQGIRNYSLPLMLLPDAGDDEWKLTIR